MTLKQRPGRAKRTPSRAASRAPTLPERSEPEPRPTAAAPRGAEPNLQILHTIAETLSRSSDVEAVIEIALDVLTQVTGHEISSLHLLSADGTALELRGERGLSQEFREVNRVLPVGQGLIGQVAATGEVIALRDVREAPGLLSVAHALVEQEHMRAFVCVPIRSHGRILGTLALGRRIPEPFIAAEITLLEASAVQIGVALEAAQLAAQARRQLEELQRAKAQLAESVRLSTIGKLAAGLVHEVNNPLTVILAQAELLLSQPGRPPKEYDALKSIVGETSRAAGLLHRMLQLARPQVPQRRPCGLHEPVRFVLDVMRHQLEKDGIAIESGLGDTPPVWVDEHQIKQVLLNLVQNAHQAMAGHPGERRLTVRTTAKDGVARVEVLDTGPGIAPSVLPRLFEAFVTTKPPGEGTGLGLWVSYAIIEQHQGRLSAANRPEGGAAFVIELPYRVRPS